MIKMNFKVPDDDIDPGDQSVPMLLLKVLGTSKSSWLVGSNVKPHP